MTKEEKWNFPGKEIKDAIHGYIMVEEEFLPVLDSAEFQRLKFIEQGSFRTVYPAARHDRFIHSLGVYHLATEFSKYFMRNIKEDLGIKLSNTEKEELLRTFRYAALLHDVGHAPFSHTSEDFFAVKKLDEYDYCQKAIDENLHQAMKKVVPEEEMQFFVEEYENLIISPKPHEIISATILIERYDEFFVKKGVKIDLGLAARMVIGCTYDYINYKSLSQKEKDILGVKNCLIRLLNSETVDVDKLDYITRDTRMSGFENVSIDVERLCGSVTAVRREEEWLYPAFRKKALSVIDNVFRAKSEQGVWLISHPTVKYYLELQKYCIHLLDNYDDPKYISEVFSLEALGKEGIVHNKKKYFLLNDNDINADFKANAGRNSLIMELFERNQRHYPVWKSYYEYNYLFGEHEEEVFLMFNGLSRYLEMNGIFAITPEVYKKECANGKMDEGTASAMKFLYKFSHENGLELDVVLFSVKTQFSARFDAEKVFIVFNSLPKVDEYNYKTYHDLKGSVADETRRMCYIFWKQKLDKKQIASFRKAIINQLKREPDRA